MELGELLKGGESARSVGGQTEADFLMRASLLQQRSGRGKGGDASLWELESSP